MCRIDLARRVAAHCTHRVPCARIPAGQSGAPTQAPRVFDHACAGQQQCPAVSAVIACPDPHPAGTQPPPRASVPAGHSGSPTHVLRALDHACAGQQQCPAVSAEVTCPPAHTGAFDGASPPLGGAFDEASPPLDETADTAAGTSALRAAMS